jgi:hypothetical protein
MGKTVVVFLGLTIFCVVVDHVYAAFGHRVRSPSMNFMFLFPFLGGALPFFVLNLVKPGYIKKTFSRIAFNLYNSGLATLTIASLLQGIVEIAGTGSEWIPLFPVAGGGFVLAGIVLALIGKQQKT